jgi:putative FmdB family regulatory protein
VPIYEYRCDECGASIEAFQKMSDDPLVTCEQCGGSLRKVLHPVAIHFKGSGFYTTDYGKGSGRRPGSRESESGEASAATGSDAAASGSDGKPDAPKKPTGDGDKPREKQKAT